MCLTDSRENASSSDFAFFDKIIAMPIRKYSCRLAWTMGCGSSRCGLAIQHPSYRRGE